MNLDDYLTQITTPSLHGETDIGDNIGIEYW